MIEQDQLKFEPTTITLSESSVSRSASLASIQALTASINYAIVEAAFKEGESTVYITTEYSIDFSAADAGSDESTTPDANVRTRYRVTMEANRPVTENDVESGRLIALQRQASSFAHPYHRQLVILLTTAIGFIPFALPVTFAMVEKQMENVRHLISE
jgi:hypothetical protein